MAVNRSWAILRTILRKGEGSFNQEIYRWFKDADEVEHRKQLRDALLITAKDSRIAAESKIRIFREQVQKVHLNRGDVVGIPKIDLDADVTYKPEVTLFFKQNKSATPDGKTAKTARISYRLMNQTSSSLSKTELKALGKSIYDDFAKPVYRFNKGKIIAWYVNPSEGLNLQIYCHSEEIGETVIKKVLSHRNMGFDNDILKFSKPNRNTDLTPGNITILGEVRQKPIWRPTVFVEFDHASINLHNDTQVRTLCDLSGTYANPFYSP